MASFLLAQRRTGLLCCLTASALFHPARSSAFLWILPHSIARSVFLKQALWLPTAHAMSSSLDQNRNSDNSMNANNQQQRYTQEAINLLDTVYGPVDHPNFPKPMPADEAGSCADGHQRRYLWTDAFGVLAYVSLAEQLEALHPQSGQQQQQQQQDAQKYAQKYRQAADKLIATVHHCLGKPRSSRPEHAMQVDPKSPTGFVGLRIGKAQSRQVTDYGMQYDGQYWHYVDKWLLALARAGHTSEGIAIAKSCFPSFFDKGPQGNGWDGGVRWKLSVDATAPASLQRAHASDDTLVALIVYSILEKERNSDDASLADEIGMLRNALQFYKPRVTDDPLGWGLEAMYDQFLQGHPRQQALASLQARALHPSHLSLPFRLYGAMIGARIAGDKVAPSKTVDELIELSLKHEEKVKGYEEHSTINRVMLAMCLLCPGALGRRPNDPLLQLDARSYD